MHGRAEEHVVQHREPTARAPAPGTGPGPAFGEERWGERARTGDQRPRRQTGGSRSLSLTVYVSTG
nr:hypothetical protein KitaXyl93_78440 [Kitasatospora sp. Xyl93]